MNLKFLLLPVGGPRKGPVGLGGIGADWYRAACSPCSQVTHPAQASRCFP